MCFVGFTSADQAYDDYFTSKTKILQALDKYGFENYDIAPLLDSAQDPEKMCSFNHLEKKFLSINPPFDFVIQTKKARRKEASVTTSSKVSAATKGDGQSKGKGRPTSPPSSQNPTRARDESFVDELSDVEDDMAEL
jgi:hypothetical protein